MSRCASYAGFQSHSSPLEKTEQDLSLLTFVYLFFLQYLLHGYYVVDASIYLE